MNRFNTLGVIRNDADFDESALDIFISGVETFLDKGSWTKNEIIKLFLQVLPEFDHKETGKYLDQRM